MKSQQIQKLNQIIEEEDKPYKNEEALELGLEKLDLNQSKLAEMMGCSAPTISNWYNKLEVGEEEDETENLNEGDECCRCGREQTPDNEGNEMCDDCIDYVRENDSNMEYERDYPKEVVEA
jgi:hypothetical protein